MKEPGVEQLVLQRDSYSYKVSLGERPPGLLATLDEHAPARADEHHAKRWHYQGYRQSSPEDGVNEIEPSNLGQSRQEKYGESGHQGANPFSCNQFAGGSLETD